MIEMTRHDREIFVKKFIEKEIPTSPTLPLLTRENANNLAYCLNNGWISARLSARILDASFEDMNVMFAYYGIDYNIGL